MRQPRAKLPAWLENPGAMAVAYEAVAAWRVERADLPEQVLSTREALQHIRYVLQGVSQDQEHLAVLALNRRYAVVEAAVLTSGNDSHTIVDPKQILRWVLTRARSTSALIIAHNHPSGDPSPSSADVEVTQRVAAGARVVGLDLLDHVIVCRAGYTSLREAGLMPTSSSHWQAPPITSA